MRLYMFKKLGQFIGRHGKATLVASIVAVSLAGFYGLGVFSNLSHADADFTDKSSQSYTAFTKIEENFKDNKSDLMVLFQAKNGKIFDNEITTNEVRRLIGTMPDALDVTSYLNTGASEFISKDGTQTFATVTIKEGEAGDVITKLRTDLKSDNLNV